jgi:hypothetical protein
MKDHEGYDYCDRCRNPLGYAYPSHYCGPCTNVRAEEDSVLAHAARIMRVRGTWDFGGKGQSELELVLADRFNVRMKGRSA